jgi:hypothetical protein
MKRFVLPMLVLGLIIGGIICGYTADQKTEPAKSEEQPKPKPEQSKMEEQEKAIAIIKVFGGTVPNKPVILVQPSDSRMSLCRASVCAILGWVSGLPIWAVRILAMRFPMASLGKAKEQPSSIR